MSEFQIRSILNRAIEYLAAKCSPQGNWEDTRSTAITLVAFSEALIDKNVAQESREILLEIMKDSKSWLVGQSRKEPRGISFSFPAGFSQHNLQIIRLSP